MALAVEAGRRAREAGRLRCLLPVLFPVSFLFSGFDLLWVELDELNGEWW